MSALTFSNWNNSQIDFAATAFKIGKYEVPQGYVNATQICKANGKLWADYKRLDKTTAFISALSRSMGIPIDISSTSTGIPVELLIVEITDGLNEYRGTWVHRRIAINLGTWISPEFDVWVATQIETLLETGKVELQPDVGSLDEEIKKISQETKVLEFELLKFRKGKLENKLAKEQIKADKLAAVEKVKADKIANIELRATQHRDIKKRENSLTQEILAWAVTKDKFTLTELVHALGLGDTITIKMSLAALLKENGYIKKRKLIDGSQSWYWLQKN